MTRESIDFRRVGNELKTAYGEWQQDNAPQFAGAIAFYTILSLAPLLVFAVTIAGTVFEAEAARGEIVTGVEQYIGRGAAEMVQEIISNASSRKKGVFATILGFAVLAFGASRIFQQLKVALNQILDVPTREGGGIMKMVWDRFVAIIAVAGVGLFLMTSILASAIISRVGDALPVPGGSLLWQVVSSLVSLALIAVVFALIFRYLPDIDLPWRQVIEGSIFTSTLFVIGQIVIGVYLSRTDPGSSFGAAGPVIVLLLWIYFTTVILFFGAEFMEVRCRKDPAYANRVRASDRPAPDEQTAPETHPGTTAGPRAATTTGAADGSNRGGAMKVAGSAALGGCAGIVIGIGSAMLGLLLASVKLSSRLFRRS